MWIGPSTPTFNQHNSKKHLNIIGAGISGLLLGYYLKKYGIAYTIWEKSKVVGGKLSSYQTELGLVEPSANAVLASPYVYQLLSELKLNPLPARPGLKRFILHQQKWIGHRTILFQLLFNLFFRGWRKIFVQPKLSLSDFFTPLMGKNWSITILSAITRGIFAQNAEKLTLDALFHPEFIKTVNQNKLSYFSFFYNFIRFRQKNLNANLKFSPKGSISFAGGMHEWIEKLYQVQKDHIQLEVSPEKLEMLIRQPGCIICTPPPHAAALLMTQNQKLADCLKKIPMQDIMSVTYFTAKPIAKLHQAFGVLLSPDSAWPFYGVLAQSEIFPFRTRHASHSCYTVMAPMQEQEKLTDAFLHFSSLKADDILTSYVHIWEKAIPLYQAERQDCIEELKQLMPMQYFFGNYLEAVGLKDLVRGAHFLAKHFDAYYQA